jgi:hypothetical protein
MRLHDGSTLDPTRAGASGGSKNESAASFGPR